MWVAWDGGRWCFNRVMLKFRFWGQSYTQWICILHPGAEHSTEGMCRTKKLIFQAFAERLDAIRDGERPQVMWPVKADPPRWNPTCIGSSDLERFSNLYLLLSFRRVQKRSPPPLSLTWWHSPWPSQNKLCLYVAPIHKQQLLGDTWHFEPCNGGT